MTLITYEPVQYWAAYLDEAPLTGPEHIHYSDDDLMALAINELREAGVLRDAPVVEHDGIASQMTEEEARRRIDIGLFAGTCRIKWDDDDNPWIYGDDGGWYPAAVNDDGVITLTPDNA